MRMMTIASGSSGNCVYIGSDNTHILIDAGISKKKIVDGLKEADLSLSDIDAIFVTHEHSDHIKGLGVLSRASQIPIYSTSGTIEGIKAASSLGKIDESLLKCILPDCDLTIKDLKIHPFRISHDANEPVAYTVSDDSKKAGLVTDLGYYDDYIVDNMKGCSSMVVEANHDINLLEVGSYPYQLKQRILSDKGHLSNENSGRLIDCLLSDQVKKVFLGHLSKENNYDLLAYET